MLLLLEFSLFLLLFLLPIHRSWHTEPLPSLVRVLSWGLGLLRFTKCFRCCHLLQRINGFLSCHYRTQGFQSSPLRLAFLFHLLQELLLFTLFFFLLLLQSLFQVLHPPELLQWVGSLLISSFCRPRPLCPLSSCSKVSQWTNPEPLVLQKVPGHWLTAAHVRAQPFHGILVLSVPFGPVEGDQIATHWPERDPLRSGLGCELEWGELGGLQLGQQ
mmetsp:Transcript_44938/g.91817  ORF Transcript_44938/g.91817 Transcript_44938/m.91817 type:complete len:216 (-) Transcript_44938:15-662(-)